MPTTLDYSALPLEFDVYPEDCPSCWSESLPAYLTVSQAERALKAHGTDLEAFHKEVSGLRSIGYPLQQLAYPSASLLAFLGY